MKYYPLRYSLKVWLAGLLIGPVVASILGCCINPDGQDAGIYILLLIPPIICIVALLTCITWLILWGAIHIVIEKVPEPFLQKFWIMLIGAVLTFGTFCLLFQGDDFLQKNDFLSLSIGYGSGVIIGIWYCDLAKPVAAQELSST